ncbi:MAG: type II toxin-antitoxin system VapC family toxin, partial [Stellaceae bacterium]
HPARAAIIDEQNDVLVSAASAWEIATKHRLGKLPGAAMLVSDIAGAVVAEGFAELPITVAHAAHAGTLPGPHRDPFDRMLIAQAMLEDFVLVSNDAVFEGYAARRLW